MYAFNINNYFHLFKIQQNKDNIPFTFIYIFFWSQSKLIILLFRSIIQNTKFDILLKFRNCYTFKYNTYSNEKQIQIIINNNFSFIIWAYIKIRSFFYLQSLISQRRRRGGSKMQ